MFKSLVRIFIFMWALSGVSFAQNVSANSVALTPYTVGTLPAASSNNGRAFLVTDGTNGIDCTTGGGTSNALCVSNGTIYAPAAGAASTVNSASQYSPTYYSGSGTSNALSGVAGSTGPDGVPRALISTSSSGVATAPTLALPGVVGRNVNASTDTIVSTDCNPKRIQYLFSGTVAVTLPTATTLGDSFCSFKLSIPSNSSTTSITVTPTTWTINGNSTLVLSTGETANIYVDPSSSTNWQADCVPVCGALTNNALLTGGKAIQAPVATATLTSSLISLPVPGVFVPTTISASDALKSDCTATSTNTGNILDLIGNPASAASVFSVDCVTGNVTGSGTATLAKVIGTGGVSATSGSVSAGSTTVTGVMCPSGVTGAWCAAEGSTAGTPTAGGDYLRADSTAHAYKASLNNGAEFLSAVNASLAPTGTIALSFASAPAGSKCVQTSGTAGLVTEASSACGSGGSPSLDQVTGSAAQATGTETAAGHEYTFAGVETANLTSPFSFTDANSTNNNTNGAVIIGTTGTSTGAVPLRVNEATAAGDLIDAYNGGTVTNGVLSGGTKEFGISATGALNALLSISTTASSPACTAGTAGFWCGAEGTAFTNASSTAGIYPDSTAHEFLAKTNGASSTGMMLRAQPGSIRSTGLVAAVSTATLCAASAGACNTPGTYAVDISLYQSGTACTANTTGGVTPSLTWTDGNGTSHSAQGIPLDTNVSATAVTGTMVWGATTLGAWGSGHIVIDTNGSVIQYAIAFAQCGTGTATYAASLVTTRLQ